MNVSLNNWDKPSNKKLKLIADIMLYSLPLLITCVTQMPISEVTQKWIIVSINIAIVGFKAVTKFTSESIQGNETQS